MVPENDVKQGYYYSLCFTHKNKINRTGDHNIENIPQGWNLEFYHLSIIIIIVIAVFFEQFIFSIKLFFLQEITRYRISLFHDLKLNFLSRFHR